MKDTQNQCSWLCVVSFSFSLSAHSLWTVSGHQGLLAWVCSIQHFSQQYLKISAIYNRHNFIKWSIFKLTCTIGTNGEFIALFFIAFQSMSASQGWFLSYYIPLDPNLLSGSLCKSWFIKSAAFGDQRYGSSSIFIYACFVSICYLIYFLFLPL